MFADSLIAANEWRIGDPKVTMLVSCKIVEENQIFSTSSSVDSSSFLKAADAPPKNSKFEVYEMYERMKSVWQFEMFSTLNIYKYISNSLMVRCAGVEGTTDLCACVCWIVTVWKTENAKIVWFLCEKTVWKNSALTVFDALARWTVRGNSLAEMLGKLLLFVRSR